MMQRLTGGDGDNHPAPCRRSTRASAGRSRLQRMRLNTPGTTGKTPTSIGAEPASFLPTLWAAKTATSPTFECGPTTPPLWPTSTVYLPRPTMRSPRLFWKARRGWTRTRCRANLPTWSPAGSPISWTCRGQITPWMPLVRRPWPLCWTPVACSKRARST